jgi:hypothetical protein
VSLLSLSVGAGWSAAISDIPAAYSRNEVSLVADQMSVEKASDASSSLCLSGFREKKSKQLSPFWWRK